MKIIITIEDGLLTGAYADSEDVSVELLDYDNYSVVSNDADSSEMAAEEASYYGELERIIEAGIASGQLVNHW